MPNIAYIEYCKLAFYLSIWCAIHSTMISLPVTNYVKKTSPHYYKYYRLFFNLIALLTLVPVIWFKYTLQSEIFFNWDGVLFIIQIMLVASGITLFMLGAKQYDSKRFLGLSQIKENDSAMGISESGNLNTSGILGIIRHPWYTGLLLVLWAQPVDISTFILNSIFTVYLYIGVNLEETKLKNEFGEAYSQYQRNVAMLFPVKWAFKKLTKI